MKQFQVTLALSLTAASLDEAREQLGDIAGSNDGSEMLANAEITEVKNHPTRSPDREANERYVHLRNLPYPGEGVGLKGDRTVTNVTAFVRTIDGTEYVSFAECDSRDQYCRRTGRVVARRKWFNGKRVPLNARWLEINGPARANLYDEVLDTYYGRAVS